MSGTRQIQGSRGRFNRRAMVGGMAAGSAALFIAACGRGGSNENSASGTAAPKGGAAAAGNATPAPRPGGILREATITQTPHFSPFHPGADPSVVNYWRRTYGYYDMLWGFKDKKGSDRFELRLASSFEQPDDLTTIVKMKPSKFHNRAPAYGRDVTAEDLAATLEFLRKPPASGGAYLQGKDFKGATAVDSLTLRYEGNKPYAFLTEVGAPVIVPKEMLDEKTLKETIPVGSGPFQYKSHTLGSIEEVARFDGWRVKEQPYLAERKLTWVPDEAAMEVAFRSGQIDGLTYEGLTNLKQQKSLESDLGSRIITQSIPSTSGMAMVVNVNRKPWDDIRVREAIYRAIDVDRIVDTIFLGDAQRTWYFSKGSFNRDPLGPEPVMQYISQDQKKAADLLKASGIDLNKEYEFMVPAETQTWVDSARLIGEDLVKVGLKTRINPVVRNIYLQRGGPKPGDFDITMSVLLSYQYAQTKSGTFWDSTSLQDAEVDAMVDKIYVTLDQQARDELSHQFETMLAKKYSNLIPILSTNQHFAWYAWVKGLDPDYNPLIGYQAKRWLDK